MNQGSHPHPNYLAVWLWLVVLAIGSVAASQLPLAHALAVAVVYGAAVAKAVLVGIYFMHLRSERPLVLGLIGVPLALFAVLLIALLPDFVI